MDVVIDTLQIVGMVLIAVGVGIVVGVKFGVGYGAMASGLLLLVVGLVVEFGVNERAKEVSNGIGESVDAK